MLRIKFDNIEEMKVLHYDAVEDYVKRLPVADQDRIYANIIRLDGSAYYGGTRDGTDYSWLRRFILADLSTLRGWVLTQADQLLFSDFAFLYERFFSNGPNHFVDAAGAYNAYTLMEKTGIRVCPYCDDEYIDLVNDGTRRTSEFDHFFPKGQTKYPALAMCFYNLVLSGPNCNGLKKQNLLGASPYDDDIEDMTLLTPDVEVGVNMDSILPEDCKVLLHAKRGMATNEVVLGLKERYANRYSEAYDLLVKKQHFPEEKIDELIRQGYFASRDEAMRALFGAPYGERKFKEIHTKMQHDMIGYSQIHVAPGSEVIRSL